MERLQAELSKCKKESITLLRRVYVLDKKNLKIKLEVKRLTKDNKSL